MEWELFNIIKTAFSVGIPIIALVWVYGWLKRK